MSKRDKHPLRPQLTNTEKELKTALDEVCEDQNVDRRTTDELIRIEETLAIATETAKEAISLRKRIKADDDPLPPVA